MNPYQKFRAARLRTRLLIVAIPFVIWIFWPANDSRSPLRPPQEIDASLRPCLEVRPVFGPYQEAIIKQPGIHCIAVNFWQQRLSNFAGHTGPAPHRHLIAVMANDVTVELANHTLHSDGDSSGVVAVRIQQDEKPVPKNMIIKNGVLDLRGLGTAVRVVDHWSMYSIDEPVPSDFPGFKKSGVILENLLIKTDNVGVILEGDGNIIRNCVIESGGDSAIMMAGPNGQILNNTIILTEPLVPTWLLRSGYIEKLTKWREYRRIARAAITLHRAGGTVIRGNRIEVKGKSATRHNIYLTDGSLGVQIEGNTIVGTEDVVTLMKGSTAELKNNAIEQRKETSWWKF